MLKRPTVEAATGDRAQFDQIAGPVDIRVQLVDSHDRRLRDAGERCRSKCGVEGRPPRVHDAGSDSHSVLHAGRLRGRADVDQVVHDCGARRLQPVGQSDLRAAGVDRRSRDHAIEADRNEIRTSRHRADDLRGGTRRDGQVGDGVRDQLGGLVEAPHRRVDDRQLAPQSEAERDEHVVAQAQLELLNASDRRGLDSCGDMPLPGVSKSTCKRS